MSKPNPAPKPDQVELDPGQEAEPASVEEIEALCNARKKAKKERDWKTADELRDQVRARARLRLRVRLRLGLGLGLGYP